MSVSVKKPFERLSPHVKPSHYNLNLTVDIDKFSFTGVETIKIAIAREGITSISLNASELTVSEAVITAAKNQVIPASNINISQEHETVTFTFANPLPTGNADLKVVFAGVLNDKLKGFYRSKYTLEGKTKYAAVTQFEATDARRCFPCWDEPAVKAKFTCSLTVPSDLLAISNTPVTSEVDNKNGTKTVSFGITPVMSTYLLAFIVGEFDYVEDKTPKGTAVRVYTPKGKKNQGEFALQVAVKTLPFYEKWFGIDYPLEKCDLLAIPDFAAGAMENWGAITYREVALLVDPQSSSAQSKQYVALVVGHELAHQWFGNLVTMEWWTHLWLNEGFASYVEYICVDLCFPEWNIWTQFVFEDLERALSLDGLSSSHPVEVEVGHPSEVDEIFDAISYSKGSCIIRMLAEYVGLDTFKKGLNAYLNRHKYSNTLTEDLWQALSEASDKNVKKIMDTWTKQMGYPVLHVTEEKSSNERSRVFKIRQNKFIEGESNPIDSSLWQVPLTIRTQGGKSFSFLITEREQTITLQDVNAAEWVKFNPRQTGFYRVHYSSALLDQFRVALLTSTAGFTAEDRVGILSDVFALAKAGITSPQDFLTVLSYYKNETNYTVWLLITKVIRELEVIIAGTNFYPKFKDFARSLYSTIVDRLTWDPKPNESHLDTMLRSLVLGMIGKYDHDPTLISAEKKFNNFLSDKNSLSPDVRRMVYSLALAGGGRPVFDKLLKLYRETDLQEEKDRILRSLGAANDVSVLKDVLNFSLGSEVRSQDSVFGLISVGTNPLGRELEWDFVKTNWSTLHERYQGGFLLSSLIKESISYFSTEKHKTEIEAFFKEHPVPGGDRAIKQGLEKISVNVKWLKRDEEAFRSFFSKFHGPSTTESKSSSSSKNSHHDNGKSGASGFFSAHQNAFVIGGVVLGVAAIGALLYLKNKK